METLTKILEFNPVLTLIFGFVLALVVMWLFRAELKEYIRKKYNLYTNAEVDVFINKGIKNYIEKTKKSEE